jgi:hypothetical protein
MFDLRSYRNFLQTSVIFTISTCYGIKGPYMEGTLQTNLGLCFHCSALPHHLLGGQLVPSVIFTPVNRQKQNPALLPYCNTYHQECIRPLSLPSLKHQRQILQQLHKITWAVQHNFHIKVQLHICQIFYQLPHIPNREMYNKLCNVCQVTLPCIGVDHLLHWDIYYFQIFRYCVHGYSNMVHTDIPLLSSTASLIYLSVFNPLLWIPTHTTVFELNSHPYSYNLLFAQHLMIHTDIKFDASQGNVLPCPAPNCEQTDHNIMKFSEFCMNQPDTGCSTCSHNTIVHIPIILK